jgi:hypothetical protein
MQSSNQTEHYRQILCYFTRNKHDCTAAERIFNWNARAAGHKEGTVGFLKGKKRNYQGQL